MALYLATKLALILSGLQLGVAYKPFLGLDELRPTNPEAFCKEHTSEPGLRHCERNIHRELDDGGIVTMNWAMDMDPSKILSLDTESEKGVRLVTCSEDSLELEIPATHKSFIKEGQFIVGSHFAHNCKHLKGDVHEHLYARIGEVRRMDGNRVQLTYHDLPTIAHVANQVQAYFEWSPAEARDLTQFPERRTKAPPAMAPSIDPELLDDDGNLLPEHERKLSTEGTWGNPTSKGTTDGGFGAFQSLLDFVPEQMSNLGWNWDFELNTTSTPQVNYTIPGGEGSILLKQPYVRAHAGIYFNFSSNLLNDFSQPPDVVFKLGLKGHGIISGKMMSELRIDDSVAGDPFNRHELPILRQLAGTMWLGSIEFAVGHLPISITPGLQFAAKAYHMGRFMGSLQVGIHTHAIINPELDFDTKNGMNASFSGELLDTQLWPPSWLIYTRRFEMGMLLEPQLWMKGRMGSIKDAMWGMSLKPYFNVSILRSGDQALGVPDFGHELVIYPFRVTGLDGDDTYLVEVEANGKKAQTSVQMNFGILEYHDRPEAFRFGHISQNMLLQEPIKVRLLKGNSSVTTVLGEKIVKCTELLNGECTPSPLTAQLTVDSKKVYIDLTAIWKKEPLPWFASKIRGVGISFPRVNLRKDVMNTLKNDLITNAQDISLRVTRSGREYDIPMSVNMTKLQVEGTTKLLGNKMIEMGPTFLDAWKQCYDASECSTPTVSLMHGDTLLGSNAIPQIPWGSAHIQNTMEVYRGGLDMGTMIIPVHLALFTPQNQFDSIGTATMEIEVTNPSQASFFVYPIGAEQVALGDNTAIVWSVGESKLDVITFALTAMKVVNKKYVPMADWSDLFAAQCTYNSVSSMSYHTSVDNPCTFEHLVHWNGTRFIEGDRVVLRVEWQEMRDGIAVTHELFSSAFDIEGVRKFADAIGSNTNSPTTIQLPDTGSASICQPIEGKASYKANCNLLNEEQCAVEYVCKWRDAPTGSTRRLTSMSSMWMQHMSELKAEDCTQNNLSFALGAGLYIKSTLKHLTVPDKFPVVGGIAEAPDITSGYVSLTPNGPMINESFADFFPDELCTDGMCSGELPGCKPERHDMRAYPRIPFKFDRNFTFYRDSSTNMKHLLAYAFSVLPEVIDVAVKSVGDWEHGSQYACVPRVGQQAYATACSQVPQAACLHHVRCEWKHLGRLSTTTTTPYVMPGNQQPINQWHNPSATTRLLTPESEEDGFETDEFEIQFNGGLPYIVDKQLISTLIKHGAFDDIGDADGKGPLRIVNFDVSHDVRAGIGDADPYDDQDAVESSPMGDTVGSFKNSGSSFTLGLFVFLMAGALVAGIALRNRKTYGRVSTEAYLEEGSSGEEVEASDNEETTDARRYRRAAHPPLGPSLYQ